MVTTRSGKPPAPNPMLIGMKARSKPAASIFIFEENPTESKKRESPCKTVNKDIKKTKTLGALPDKENTVKVAVNQLPPASLACDTKKIQISQDEKLMNGAPEGDLFDMVVFEDTELWPYSSDTEAHEEFVKCYKTHQESTVWAEQYESVVVMRRVVLHHPSVINTDPAAVSQLVTSTIAGVESLRSCRVRSGIMGLRGILKHCSTALSATPSSSSSAAPVDHCAGLIACLLAKTGGGPKFICELASNILFQEAVANVPPLTLIRCLLPFVAHRNPELSGNAIQAIVLSSQKIQSEFLMDPNESSMHQLKDLMQGLAQAINAKKPAAKESAKTALKYLVAQVGETQFRNLLQMHTSESQMGEVLRMVAVGSSSSSASASSTAAAIGVACTPSPQVVRPGLNATFSCGMPSGASTLQASAGGMSSKFARKPLQPPSSATTGATSSVSKFKMHMMAQSVDRGAVEIVCAAPRSAIANASVLNTSSESCFDAAAPVPVTPVLSVRDHIMLMKQQKRLQTSQQTPTAVDVDVQVLVSDRVSSEPAEAIASIEVGTEMDVSCTPCTSSCVMLSEADMLR